VFGEGIAVLAGGRAFDEAFELAANGAKAGRAITTEIILELSHASGSLQLIAGQVADLEAKEGISPRNQLRLHSRAQDSALLCCAVRLGAMSANCTSPDHAC